MTDLKESVRKALIEEIGDNLDRYFDFESYQTDVDDDYFRFDGSKHCEAEDIDAVCNGKPVYFNAVWDDYTELDYHYNFKLRNVVVEVFDYDGRIAKLVYEEI